MHRAIICARTEARHEPHARLHHHRRHEVRHLVAARPAREAARLRDVRAEGAQLLQRRGELRQGHGLVPGPVLRGQGGRPVRGILHPLLQAAPPPPGDRAPRRARARRALHLRHAAPRRPPRQPLHPRVDPAGARHPAVARPARAPGAQGLQQLPPAARALLRDLRPRAGAARVLRSPPQAPAGHHRARVRVPRLRGRAPLGRRPGGQERLRRAHAGQPPARPHRQRSGAHLGAQEPHPPGVSRQDQVAVADEGAPLAHRGRAQAAGDHLRPAARDPGPLAGHRLADLRQLRGADPRPRLGVGASR